MCLQSLLLRKVTQEAPLSLKKTMSELLNYKYRLLKHGQIQETRKFSSHTIFHSTWESTRTNAPPPPHPHLHHSTS